MSQAVTKRDLELTRYRVAGIFAFLAGATFVLATMESLNHARHSDISPLIEPFGLWESVRQLFAGHSAIYSAGYALYFTPLFFTAFWRERGAARRTLVGFALQLLPGVLAPPILLPCLHGASLAFVAFAVGRVAKARWTWVLFATAGIISFNSVLIGQHHDLDALLGLGLGWVTFKIAFSRVLSFLDTQSPWKAVQFELRDRWNLWVSNQREYWEATHAAGEWDFLDKPDQRCRHYIIAGAVEDRFPGGADILDVGCGNGVLYPLLRKSARSYTGIDLAEAAISRCRQRFADDPKCSFHVRDFAEYSRKQGYDVVVLNEVIYYFPQPVRGCDA